MISKKKVLSLSFFVFYIFLGHGQTIKGIVKNTNNEFLSAKLLIKTALKPKLISEFSLAKNGILNYKLRKTYRDTIILEIAKTGYKSIYKRIHQVTPSSVITFNAKLIKTKITPLEEVLISTKSAIKIKKDTIVYNINAFKDGSERKTEDLIKKLPGIEVNKKSGQIRYKGKLIETVTLDGDNLFGYNYTIGTKNINIDMVDEIEAIENYSENPLLKNIENSNNVILNLKLKKNKTDLSTNLELGIGDFTSNTKTPVSTNINLLAVNKLLKSFSTLDFNTIGKKNNPFGFSANFNPETFKEHSLFAKKIIPEHITQLHLNQEERGNFNSELFGSLNSIFNLNKKTKIKTNLYHYNDKINSTVLSTNNYEINNESINTFDDINVTKKPKFNRADLELKYNISKTSNLKYTFSIRKDKTTTNQTIFSNQENNFKSKLFSDDFFSKQHLVYTKKFKKKQALQIQIQQSTNTIKQEYNITPLTTNLNSNTYDKQNIYLEKEKLWIKTSYFNAKKQSKYNLSIGANTTTEPFKSSLNNNQDNTKETDEINNHKYNKKSIYSSGYYTFKFGKLNIKPSYIITLLNQKLDNFEDNSHSKTTHFFIEPNLNVSYKVSKSSFLLGSIGLNTETNPSQFLFKNRILINNRTRINNIYNLKLQKKEFYNLSYHLYDLFNQFQLNLDTRFSRQKSGFFSNSIITNNTINTQYFFLPETTNDLDFSLDISKYIIPLQTTFKLSSNYSISNYKNIVNSSSLRDNKSLSSTTRFFFKTAFETKINFENEFFFSLFKSKSELEFKTITYQNTLKTIFIPSNQFNAKLSFNYFVPNTAIKKENFLFIDLEAFYKPVNKNWTLSLSSSNITNKTHITQSQNNDFSFNSLKQNILSHYFLLTYAFNF